MKRLFLVRHAKSSWQDTKVVDFERPLNRRGEHDIPIMGERLARSGIKPRYVLSSPAVRAIATARALTAALGGDPDRIEQRPGIYEADAGDLLAMVRAFPADWDLVMVCGHNPAITDLVNALTDEIIENVPTCGFAEIVFETDTWSTVGVGTGQLTLFEYPKGEFD